MKTIEVLLINETGAKFVHVEDDNKAINKLLGWDDAWNVPTISVMNRKYLCVCSDTGKIRHEKVSALSLKNIFSPKETLQETFIVGSIIITKFDGIDDFESLNDEDKNVLLSSIMRPSTNSMYFPDVLVLDY